MSHGFKMRLHEVYRFSDGRLVMVGKIEGDKFIRKCTCELYLDETLVQEFVVEGEMLTNPTPQTGKRSISTQDRLKLDPNMIKAQRYTISTKANSSTPPS